MVAVMGKSAHSHIVRLTHSRRHGPNRIMTKALWLYLKKGDWHERGSVTDRYHDRSGKPDKRSDQKLGQKSSQRQLSDARQLGCVFQDMTPPKSILRKSTDMPKTKVQEGYCASYLKFETKIPRSVTFVQVNLMSVAPMLQNLRIVHKKKQSGKS